jgi:hypothetical protein
VVAVQVAEDRLQPDHPLAVQRHIHAEDAVRRGMVRPHGHFQQLAFAVRLNHRRPVPASTLLRFVLSRIMRSAHPDSFGWPYSSTAFLPATIFAAAAAVYAPAPASTSSCAVGSYSKSSGST